VTWLWSFASGTHVRSIESDAVGPTVVHDGAIGGQWRLVSNGGSGKCNMHGVVAARGDITGSGCNDGIGALETGLGTG